MASSAAVTTSHKDEQDDFEDPFRFGATSASVEADAAPKDSRCVSLEYTAEHMNGLPSPGMSSDMPPLLFSSPDRSPSATAVLVPPRGSGSPSGAHSPVASVSWLEYPSQPSNIRDMHSCSPEHHATVAVSALACAASPKERAPQRHRLLAPTLTEPAFEDCSSVSSISTADKASPSIFSKAFRAEHLAASTTEACPPLKTRDGAARQAISAHADQDIEHDNSRHLIWSPTNAKTSPVQGSSAPESTIAASLHSQWTSHQAQVAYYPAPKDAQPSTGSPRAIDDSSSGWGRTVTLGGEQVSRIEHLDNPDDGRSWLDHLEKLRNGAPKDEYKRERSRIVDALIRRAAAYPKVSGIYFDKHQLRWSVGWAHNGRRAAKYFPVRLFGMREGYGMAVSFKSTKAASVDGSSSLASTSETAAEIPAVASATQDPVPEDLAAGGALGAHLVETDPPLGADSPPRLSTGSHSSIGTGAVPPTRAWHNEHVSSGNYADDPLGKLVPSATPSGTLCSPAKVGEVAINSCSLKVHPTRCGDGLPASSWQQLVSPRQTDAVNAAYSRSDPNAQPAASEQNAHQLPMDLFFFRPAVQRWPCGALVAEDQSKTTAARRSGGVEMCESAFMASPLSSRAACSSNTTPVSQLEYSAVLRPTYVFLQQDHAEAKKETVFFRNAKCLESTAVDSRVNALAMPTHGQSSNCSQGKIQMETHGSLSSVLPATQEQCSEICTYGTGNLPPLINQVGHLVWPALQRQGLAVPNPSYGEEPTANPPLAPKRLLITPDPLNRQIYHTPGIHFDKHSMRWKATWYDTSGQRKAKYFPVGRYGFDLARLLAVHTRLSNHVPRGARSKETAATEDLPHYLLSQPGCSSPLLLPYPATMATHPLQQADNAVISSEGYKYGEVSNLHHEPGRLTASPSSVATHGDSCNTLHLCGAGALTDGAYDEERDRRFSNAVRRPIFQYLSLCFELRIGCDGAFSLPDKAPSRVLIRHASRLARVPGIWFDKKQLRWACTFTDVQSGKRRAEYFPIRHFGFLGARLLAVNARRKMERLRSHAGSSAQPLDPLKCVSEDRHEASMATQGTKGKPLRTDCHLPGDAGMHDLWNKYVLETLQRRDLPKPSPSCTREGTFFTLSAGCLVAADGWSCSDANNQVEQSTGAAEHSSVWAESESNPPSSQARKEAGSLVMANSESVLSLGREAIRFLLSDLGTHCLTALAPGLSPADCVSHMAMLQRHARWIDTAEHCRNLEQYLVIFAGCIKRMKLPSHLCRAEQWRLLQSVAALSVPPVVDD